MKKTFKIIGIIGGIVTAGGIVAATVDLVKEKRAARRKAQAARKRGIYEAFFKRMLDFMCGCAAIIVFWPVYLVVAILVRIKHGKPVLFGQERPGKDENIFKLYKFRSMTNERDENGNLLPDDVRLTKFGKMLRATSLDELPEALNIIKGDMSVIGPRPLLVEYLPYYTEREHHRHDVRPGLTGWAQVNGRNSVDWDRRFALDVEYVNNISLLLDVKIIFMTITKVLKKSDVAENTRNVEGNFAEIRKAKLEAGNGKIAFPKRD